MRRQTNLPAPMHCFALSLYTRAHVRVVSTLPWEHRTLCLLCVCACCRLAFELSITRFTVVFDSKKNVWSCLDIAFYGFCAFKPFLPGIITQAFLVDALERRTAILRAATRYVALKKTWQRLFCSFNDSWWTSREANKHINTAKQKKSCANTGMLVQ